MARLFPPDEKSLMRGLPSYIGFSLVLMLFLLANDTVVKYWQLQYSIWSCRSNHSNFRGLNLTLTLTLNQMETVAPFPHLQCSALW